MASVEMFKGCALRAKDVGIDKEGCQQLCRVSSRNISTCTKAQCASPWRYCAACVAQGVREPNVVARNRIAEGLCKFHAENGAKASDTAKANGHAPNGANGHSRHEPDPFEGLSTSLISRPTSRQVFASPPAPRPALVSARPTSPPPAPAARTSPPVPAARSSSAAPLVVGIAAAVASTKAAALSANPPAPKVIPKVSEELEEVDINERKERFKAIVGRARKAIAEGVLVTVPLEEVYPMQGQPRVYFDPASLTTLAESIRAFGQVQPGYIRKRPRGEYELYEILDGERRWRALAEAQLSSYRAILIEIDDEAAPFIIAAIANFNRAEHTPMEVSDAIDRMHTRLGLPMVDIAQCLGMSLKTAYGMHSLQNLHPSVRDMVNERTNPLAVTAAQKICPLPKDKQVPLALDVRAGRISLSELRKKVLEIANEAGVYVRQRTVDPSEDWRTAVRKVELLERQARDLHDRLKKLEPNLQMALLGKKNVAAGAIGGLQKAIASLQGAQQIISVARR